MFKNLLLTIVLIVSVCIAQAQTTLIAKPAATSELSDSAKQAQIKEYYSLGAVYREGKGVAQDFEKAFAYFSKAADLGDAQSLYAVAYMHYKGLGTTQDYELAAKLFQQGAFENRANSMYFYALCWRNGYGLPQNEDSSLYWLNKASALGYKQAELELKTETAENSNDSAKNLVQRIQNAAIPEKAVLNQFVPIKPSLPDSEAIEGEYEGYLIQYDWSGKNAVSSKKLKLSIEAQSAVQPNIQSSIETSKAMTADASAATDNQKRTTTGLSGNWREEGADTATAKFKAVLQKDSLVFSNTRYSRKDHYSPNRAVNYDFQKASLNLVRKGDSVYLAGNVYMYSPDRKEPSKPLFVALVKTTADNPETQIQKQTEQQTTANEPAAKILKVYPNPFTSYVTVEFEVNRETNVAIELYNMAGALVYRKPSQQLTAGRYAIHAEPQTRLATQTYLLRLVFDNGQETVKVRER